MNREYTPRCVTDTRYLENIPEVHGGGSSVVNKQSYKMIRHARHVRISHWRLSIFGDGLWTVRIIFGLSLKNVLSAAGSSGSRSV